MVESLFDGVFSADYNIFHAAFLVIATCCTLHFVGRSSEIQSGPFLSITSIHVQICRRVFSRQLSWNSELGEAVELVADASFSDCGESNARPDDVR